MRRVKKALIPLVDAAALAYLFMIGTAFYGLLRYGEAFLPVPWPWFLGGMALGPVGRAVYTVIRVTVSLMRSIDAVIWAVLFVVWVGSGSFAGALALLIHSIADLVKLYSEQVENIDPGTLEAITACGGNRLQVVRYGVIPQIVNPYISFTLYRWDINVRMATIVGAVGGGGIGKRLFFHLKAWEFTKVGMLTLLVIALVWAIDYLSARLRAKLA